jgi:hypothetical protein
VDEVSYGLLYDPIQALKLGSKTLWPNGLWDSPWPDPIRKVTMVLYGPTSRAMTQALNCKSPLTLQRYSISGLTGHFFGPSKLEPVLASY